MVIAVYENSVDAEGNTPMMIGTAWLISKNAAVTAAHCIYSKTYGWPTQISVVIGANCADILSYMSVYNVSNVTEAVVSMPWYTQHFEGNLHDWALLRLENEIGLTQGFLGFQYIARNAENTSLLTAGYPSDLNSGVLPSPEHPNATTYQYYTTETIDEDSNGTSTSNNTTIEFRTFFTDLDAIQGQSGSPLLYYTEGSYVGIGLITEDHGSVYTQALGITSQLFSFMLAYKNNS